MTHISYFQILGWIHVSDWHRFIFMGIFQWAPPIAPSPQEITALLSGTINHHSHDISYNFHPLWMLHPWNLTWNLKRSPWKRRFLLETIIFRFHVNLRGSKGWQLDLPTMSPLRQPLPLLPPPPPPDGARSWDGELLDPPLDKVWAAWKGVLNLWRFV